MKHIIALFALFLSVTSHALADIPGAKQFAVALADNAIEVLENGNLSQTGKQNALEGLFAKSVDLDWVARFVLGKHWRTATPQQKEAYAKNYKTFVIRNFTRQLTGYAGQDYTIKQVTPLEEKGEYLLTLEISGAGEPPIFLDYRLRETGDSFLIFDIVIEGVSLISTQRSEFSSVVDRKGLPFLIEALGKRAKI